MANIAVTRFKKGQHPSPQTEFKKGVSASPQTQFAKGFTPWNKGKVGVQVSTRKGMKFPEREGGNHPLWRGNKVGYSALHWWIKQRLAKPWGCNHCGKIKSLELANKSHEYKRELDDWLWLCKSCHKKYDLQFRGKKVFQNHRRVSLCLS